MLEVVQYYIDDPRARIDARERLGRAARRIRCPSQFRQLPAPARLGMHLLEPALRCGHCHARQLAHEAACRCRAGR
jgi:hypothetical protein